MPEKAGDNAIKTLKADLKSGNIRPLYIFHGTEKYLLEYYLGEIEKALIDPAMREFNDIRFSQQDITAAKLIDTVEGYPAFSDRKLIVLNDIDLQKPVSDDGDLFERIFSDIPDYCCIVAVYDVLPYKLDSRKKISKIIKEKGFEVEFPEQEPRMLISWLKNHFKSAGKILDTDVGEYMLFVCGRSMNKLAMECEKLSAYAKGDFITKADIDAACIPVVEAVVYEISDAVLEKNYGRAILLLRELEANKEEPVATLSAFGRQFRQLMYIKTLLSEKTSEGDIGRLLNLRSNYVVRKLCGTARMLSVSWPRKAVVLCTECDYALKSSGGDKYLLLEDLVMELAAL